MSANVSKEKSIHYAKDIFGKKMLADHQNKPIRMEWEKPYLEACAEAIKPKGNVLLVGFGLGFAADRIQKFHPDHLTIVETSPGMIEKVEKWIHDHPKTTLLRHPWDQTIPKLGTFQAILFDDYGFHEEIEQHATPDTATLKKMAAQTRQLHDQLEVSLRAFRNVRFSDQELRSFAQKVLTQYQVTPEYVLQFIGNLVDWGNITADQKNAFEKEFALEHTKKTAKQQPSLESQLQTSSFLAFIDFAEVCLNKHMHVGSHLSGYMNSPESKREHSLFKERILNRKDVHYSEKLIQVEVPSNCDYYKADQALIIVIEKK